MLKFVLLKSRFALVSLILFILHYRLKPLILERRIIRFPPSECWNLANAMQEQLKSI